MRDSFPRKRFMQLDLFSLKYFLKNFSIYDELLSKKNHVDPKINFQIFLKSSRYYHRIMIHAIYSPPPPFSVAHFSSLTFQLLHKSRNINQLPFSLISSNLVSFPQNPKSLSRSTSKDSFRPKNEKKKKKRIKQKKLFLIQKFLLL